MSHMNFLKILVHQILPYQISSATTFKYLIPQLLGACKFLYKTTRLGFLKLGRFATIIGNQHMIDQLSLYPSRRLYAVYRVALKQPHVSSLVVNHRTADVRLTLDGTLTLVLVPVELSTIISGSHAVT